MAKPKQAFVVEKTALPVCGGCSQCGDMNEKHLYILAYDKRYYCKVCFHKMAVKWPKPGRVADTLVITRSLVEQYLAEIAGGAKRAGKVDKRSGRNVSIEETELDHAVECAIVKMLTRQDPDTGYRKNWNDGGIDGTFSNGVTLDVKCTVVRSNWEGIKGFNSPTDPTGRIKADLLVAALVKGDLSRIEAIGWCRRDASMVRIDGFDKPAYPRDGLKGMTSLVTRAEALKNGKDRVQAVHGDDQVRDRDDRGLCSSNG